MPFPNTAQRLREAGYVYDNDATCRGCGADIQWWITPKGKKMPMSFKQTGNVKDGFGEVMESHFSSCPNANSFRR